jgi:multidrug efflux pump subunit AcrA (membrane-fusion protein)
MKNAFIVLLLLALTVVGYYAATTLRLANPNVEGKTEKIRRGDLSLPINATGEVKPALRIEIKSEASGEVIEIARRPGDRVKAGELLIRLQKDDEQRSINRASQDLQSAKARLDTARIHVDLARDSDLRAAQSQVDQLAPLAELTSFRLNKVKKLPSDQTNEEEILQRTTDHQRQVAQLEAAQANLEKARLAVPLAEHDMTGAQATFEAAKSNLADAEKRLSKTDIVSPISGIVADVRTQIGEVIQGGKTTLTGGTVLAVVLDDQKVLVRAEVDEADIGRIREIAPPWAIPGRQSDVQMPTDIKEAIAQVQHPPTITVQSFRDEDFAGVIERIYPEPKSLTGVVTYLVDVVITSENRSKLLTGMRADVSFTSQYVQNALLCPNEAIREGPRGKLGVYVPKPDSPPGEHETQFVDVRFGLDNGNYSEVLEGLDEGIFVYIKLPAKPEKEKEKKRT